MADGTVGPRGGGAPREYVDRVVGLDVGGTLFYTNLSTLTNASKYFAARFAGGDSLSPGEVYTDERGRAVYFLDRSSTLFRIILDFLREGVQTWPSFREDPVLWRRLQAEANFLAIDDLGDRLNKRGYQCSPENGDRKGILYWLGTTKGTRNEYQNPYAIGEVNVVRYLPDTDNEEVFLKDSIKCMFVEYRHEVNHELYGVLTCDQAIGRNPSVITFKSVSIKPTHYALQWTPDCYGMNVWNFEGSIDGKVWNCLHEARNDPYLLEPPDDEYNTMCELVKNEARNDPHLLEPPNDEFNTVYELDEEDASIRKLRISKWLAQHCRHTWKLDPAPDVFYRHFRFIGVGEDKLNALERENGDILGCMHGDRFEVFGEVLEH